MQRDYASKGVAVVAGTIDTGGVPALLDFVQRFQPGFAIGAMDPNVIMPFGQWGPRRTFVPMLYLIDKAGNIQSQYMGSDAPMFEGDQSANLRGALDKLIGTAKKPEPARGIVVVPPAKK